MSSQVVKHRQSASKRIKKNDAITGSENLIPILDKDGKVIAYEQTMDPKKREALQVDKHMGRVLGAWSGRIVEETQSDKFNEQLVLTTKKMNHSSPREKARV